MKDNFYFDNAATTWPKPETVYQFMDGFFRSHGVNPGRGGHTLAVEADAMVGQTRNLLAQFFGFQGRGGLPEIIECLQKLQLPRIQAFIAGVGYRERYAVSETDLHPNAAGHAELCKRILQWLERGVLK